MKRNNVVYVCYGQVVKKYRAIKTKLAQNLTGALCLTLRNFFVESNFSMKHISFETSYNSLSNDMIYGGLSTTIFHKRRTLFTSPTKNVPVKLQRGVYIKCPQLIFAIFPAKQTTHSMNFNVYSNK